jgi:hypothetical protein
MKTSVKKWWVQALVGGRYIQGREYLCKNSMCLQFSEFSALGILCDLYTIRTNRGEYKESQAPGGVLAYQTDDGEESLRHLPQAVMLWAELAQLNPSVRGDDLASLNERWSFIVLAQIIEEHF